MKKLLLIGLAGIMLTACSPEEKEPIIIADEEVKEEESVTNTGWVSEDEENIEEDTSQEEESKDDFKREDITRKLSFDKEIQVIHVEEVNNNALEERPLGGIASQVSTYYSEDELLYLFYDAELPTEETELIITQGQFNNDYLLNHDTFLSDDKSFQLTFSPLENELINNSNRLFIDDKLEITQADNQAITVTFNGNNYTIEKGEEQEVILENGDNESTITIKNYGLLNSIKNMTYEEIEGTERPPFPEDDEENEELEKDEEENEDN